MGQAMSGRKVALVTASGKHRIGWHVADALARRGYSLAIHYFHAVTEAAESVAAFRQQGVDVEAYQVDLTDESAVGALIGNVLERFGRLDVLVNCAASGRVAGWRT